MKNLGLWCMFFLVFAGCRNFSESLTGSIDARSFRFFGGTFFSSAEDVSIKQVLLDTPSFMSRHIIVEGVILNVGDHFTYLVIGDDSAKLLVVLTAMDSYLLKASRSQHIKVLGQIESGKKGLPFIRAKSIREI